MSDRYRPGRGSITRLAVIIGLGARLTAGRSQRGWIRLALTVIGIALAVCLLLVAIAVPSVLRHRDARASARTAICTATAQEPSQTCGLLGTAVHDQWRGRPLDRQLVDGRAGPVPPGLTRLPGPGQVVLSPALERLYADPANSALRGRLPGTVIDTISTVGLVQPDELLAYLSIRGRRTSATAAAARVIGFGTDRLSSPSSGPAAVDSTGQSDQRKTVFTVLALVIAMLTPILLFLASCSRLSARSRDRRLRALRLLGLTRRQVQLLNAVETGLLSAVGAAAGLGVFEALRVSVAFHVGSYGWFPDDAQPPAAQVVGVIVAVPVLAIAVGVAAVRRVAGPLRAARADARPRPLSWWRLAPLVSGAALLVSVAVTSSPRLTLRSGQLLLVTGAGLLLTLVGIATATPLLAQLIAAAAAGHTSSLSAQLGARRLQLEPAAATRVVSGLVLLVFLSIFGQTVLAGVRGTVDSATFSHTLAPQVLATSPVVDQPLPASRTFSAVAGVRRVIPVVTLQPTVQDGRYGQALVISCADLDALLKLACLPDFGHGPL